VNTTLRQSQLRVSRAGEKLSDLKLEINLARQDALQVAAEQPDYEAMQMPLEKFSYPLWDEGRMLISEFAFHARVALDYVVFALARRDTGTEQEGTQFPINESPEAFARNGKRGGCLQHLTVEHRAMIERFQPYQGFRLHCLRTLHKLSNSDKHRYLAHIGFMGMGWQDPLLNTRPPDVGFTQVNIGRRFEVLLHDAGVEAEDALKTLTDILVKVREIVDYFDAVLG
jgi:hypothetical protein